MEENIQKKYEGIYLSEIKKRTEQAIGCVEKMKEILKVPDNYKMTLIFFEQAEYFLYHASAISFLLWPSSINYKNKSKIAEERALHLRNSLSIDANNILQNRDLRNHLVHFDERLDTWVHNSNRHNCVDQCILADKNSIGGVDPSDYMRKYVRSDCTYCFGGECFNIQKMVDAISEIKDSVSQFFK